MHIYGLDLESNYLGKSLDRNAHLIIAGILQLYQMNSIGIEPNKSISNVQKYEYNHKSTGTRYYWDTKQLQYTLFIMAKQMRLHDSLLTFGG